MSKFFYFAFLIVCLLVFNLLIFSQTAQAAIVHCGRLTDDPGTTANEKRPCTTCDLLVLGKNIIDFSLTTAAPAVATLLFVWAGFLVLLGGANPSRIAIGKKIFTNTVIGLFIIFGAWLVANTVIRSLAADDNISDSWFKIECKTSVSGPGGGGTGGGGASPLCNNPPALAQEYGTLYPRGNAPELTNLINCIQNKIPGNQLGEISTFDKSYELCNYSRGNGVCGVPCTHKVNSCHYGGRTGSQGALAVDFGNQTIGDRIIDVAKECGAKFAECENANGQKVACAVATHVHVSTQSCSGN